MLRTYLRWSLCTLYLHACQVRVTVADSGLCCCTLLLCCTCVTYFECSLTLLCVDSDAVVRTIAKKTKGAASKKPLTHTLVVYCMHWKVCYNTQTWIKSTVFRILKHSLLKQCKVKHFLLRTMCSDIIQITNKLIQNMFLHQGGGGGGKGGWRMK